MDMHTDQHTRCTTQQKQSGRAVTNTPGFNHPHRHTTINLHKHKLAQRHAVTRREMTYPATIRKYYHITTTAIEQQFKFFKIDHKYKVKKHVQREG